MDEKDREELEEAVPPEEPAAEAPKSAPRRKFRSTVIELTETLVKALTVVAILFVFGVRVITVSGSSMNPTYYDGDRVLVSKLAGEIRQGDVVIVVNALKMPIIKRVIATEGQEVSFDEELLEVKVDGEVIPGAVYGISNGITFVPDYPDRMLEFPQTVPEGCVFVLGDNRMNSRDSRFQEVGMVDLRNVLGKVIFNIYPFSIPGK